MTTGWIKLTAPEAAAIAVLGGSNRTNNFLRPRSDAAGDAWLPAGVLDEDEAVFAHYRPILENLAVTQAAMPAWPAEGGV